MNDQYERQLVRELEVHAEDPSVPAGLAGRVIDRAHVVRRRRQAVVASVAAVGAVAGILLAANGFGGSTGADNRPAGSTSPPSPSVSTDDVVPIQLERLPLRPQTDPASGLSPLSFATADGQVQVGGVRFRLPAHWTALSVLTAGDGLVLHVTVPAPAKAPFGRDFVAYLSAHGVLRRLAGVHLPLLVNPTGTLLLARTDDTTGPLGVGDPLVTIGLPKGPRTAVPAPSGGPASPDQLQVQGFAGHDSVVVSSGAGDLWLWQLTTGRLSTLPSVARVLAASPRGDRLVDTGHEVVMQMADGAERWRSLPLGDVIGFSPPGDLLAALTPAGRPTGITVRDFGSGQELVHFALRPANQPGKQEGVWAGWADDRTLIVQTGGMQGADARYARCTIGTATCTDLGLIPAQLELPGQLFFE